MRRAYATVVGYRRPIRVNIRRKKPSNHNPSVDPCKDCKRLPAWYRVEEVVKYEWKTDDKAEWCESMHLLERLTG